MINTSGSLTYDGNIVLSFALGVGLTIHPTYICFNLNIFGIDPWHLVDGVTLWACFLILVLFSEVTDLDIGESSSKFNSWTLSNINFLSKSS